MRELVRFDDWPARFSAIMEERRARPFDGHTVNCCLFAADVAVRLTGEDLASDYRGKDYRDQWRLLRREGGIEALLRRQLPEITPGSARKGDVALLGTPRAGWLTAGVVSGPHVFFPQRSGLERVPLFLARSAFQIG